MSYTDFKNISANLQGVGTATFGAVASAGVGTAVITNKNWKAFAGMNLGAGVNPGSLTCWTPPSGSMVPCTVAVMDGTATLATAVVTTFTAGQNVLLTAVRGASVAAGDTVTVNVVGTATASVAAGQNTGAYDIFLFFNPAYE